MPSARRARVRLSGPECVGRGQDASLRTPEWPVKMLFREGNDRPGIERASRAWFIDIAGTRARAHTAAGTRRICQNSAGAEKPATKVVVIHFVTRSIFFVSLPPRRVLLEHREAIG